MSSKVNSKFPPIPSSLTQTGAKKKANKKELVDDLMVKAKQIEYLIQSLPTPEPEEVQVRVPPFESTPFG